MNDLTYVELRKQRAHYDELNKKITSWKVSSMTVSSENNDLTEGELSKQCAQKTMSSENNELTEGELSSMSVSSENNDLTESELRKQ